MNNEFVSVRFNAPEESAAIVTALLFDIGFEGMEEKEDEYIISIKKELFNEDELRDIMDKQQTAYSLEITAEQNWNARWESSFEPVQVENFALIRASFHEPRPGILYDIIITPKMSFGTGHHATTYLMIQIMKDMDFADKTVIDFGTGTGVLAILAEKLSAGNVLGIDNDEWSINNGEENIAANNCEKIELQLANEMLHREQAGIVLANINLNVIVANLEKIKAACLPDAWVLFSGLMTADEEVISKELVDNGFHIEKIEHRNGWIALLTRPVVFPQD